jgi:GNAT superfamily N-acetyltransferase
MAPAEAPEVHAVTCRAFWFDPLIDFFSRDLLTEYRNLPLLFEPIFADLRDEHGSVTVAEHRGRPRAVAGWLAPGRYPRPRGREARYTARAARSLFRAHHRKLAVQLLREVDKRHPHEPHWYLALLATDPTAQGLGLGTALLAPVLARCDDEGVLAYTETQKFENVAWYGRAGFTVAEEVGLPGTPTVWCLRREPR